jgi:hypothetical protein
MFKIAQGAGFLVVRIAHLGDLICGFSSKTASSKEEWTFKVAVAPDWPRTRLAEPGRPGQDTSAGRTRTAAARARLPGGRVLLVRSVAGSARLTRLASLLLHTLARSIAGGSRLTWNRALVLHTLPWRAILRRALCRAHQGHREQQAASGCNRKNFIPHYRISMGYAGDSAITRCAEARFRGSKQDGHASEGEGACAL